MSAALHAILVMTVATAVETRAVPGLERRQAASASDQPIPHIVFLAPESPRTGGGGGGGGNQQPGTIRRAQGAGPDKITLRTRQPLPLQVTAVPDRVEDVPTFPSILLDVEPLASGVLEQVGLPTGGTATGTSTGPGSGGGVGSGVGTGIGPGHGPGLGPGSGGGTGGGVYRAGGAVSSPRLIKEVRPHYTERALRNMTQGRVAMEAVITRDGRPTDMRIIRSLDRGGLDEEAIAAVAQWRFEPGRLDGVPVKRPRHDRGGLLHSVARRHTMAPSFRLAFTQELDESRRQVIHPILLSDPARGPGFWLVTVNRSRSETRQTPRAVLTDAPTLPQSTLFSTVLRIVAG